MHYISTFADSFNSATDKHVIFCYVVCQHELLLSVTRLCGEIACIQHRAKKFACLARGQCTHSRADLCCFLSSQGSLLSLHEALLGHCNELLIRHCLAGHLALRRSLSLRSTALIEAASTEGLNISR